MHETAWVHHKGITCLDSDDNHSFMVKDDSNVVAIVSFNVEKHVIDSNTYLTATLFGLSNPQPIVNQKYIGSKQLKKINDVTKQKETWNHNPFRQSTINQEQSLL